MLTVLSPALAELIDPAAELELVADGFGFTEGPVWDASTRSLLFSDIPGETRHRWSAERGVELDRRWTHKANGLALDLEGRLLSCEHATSMLVRIDDGVRTPLAWHWRGRGLNSPNDVVVRSDGAIYFTDPTYGRRPTDPSHGLDRPLELDFRAVFRLVPGQEVGEPECLVDDFDLPNGLCFSPDESFLYVSDSGRMHVRRFPVLADGSLGAGEVWFEIAGDPRRGVADGLKVDERGNVWVTGGGGIGVVSPGAQLLGTLPTPEIPANLAWGDDDLRTLFVTASTGLYRVRTLVAGHRLPHLV